MNEEILEQIFHKAARDYFETIDKQAVTNPEILTVNINGLLSSAASKIRSGDWGEAVKVVALCGLFACVLGAVTNIKVTNLTMAVMRDLYKTGCALQEANMQDDAAHVIEDVGDVELEAYLDRLFKPKGGG